MALLQRFGNGLQLARKKRGLTQEDFSTISSRNYLSSLERGIKAPTITKVEQIASVIGIHPLTLLALAYLPAEPQEREALYVKICKELSSLKVEVETQE